MYLLDTDTTIYILEGHAKVPAHLRAHLLDPMSLSAISLMELYYGAWKSRHVAGNLSKIRTLESKPRIIPLGNESAEVFGMIKADLEKKGMPLDDFDPAVASCALAYNLVLVTNNLKHFQRIDGLKLENWTE
jgi:predicted nucleic acid-binding protein